MQINAINNQSFGARIRISKLPKAAKEDFRDASIISGLGTSLSGTGILSCLPASDPVHHVHISAKAVDCGFAVGGSACSAGGGACMKFAHSLFKNGLKNTKIPT